MMCPSCKRLADESRKRRENPGYQAGSNRWLRHTNKGKPHCEDPMTCTCQHRRPAE